MDMEGGGWGGASSAGASGTVNPSLASSSSVKERRDEGTLQKGRPSEGGSYSASDRKRPRRQEEEEEEATEKEAVAGDVEQDVKVNSQSNGADWKWKKVAGKWALLRRQPPRVEVEKGKVGSKVEPATAADKGGGASSLSVNEDGDDVKLKVSSQSTGADWKWKKVAGKWALLRRQPPRVEKGKAGSKVEPATVDKGGDAAAETDFEAFENLSTEEEEEEAHPCLFIANILDVVFKHILKQPGIPPREVAKDVQSVRLVCKTWKDSVTRAYRRTGPFQTIERYDRGDGNNHGTSLRDLLAMVECCELIPVQKFNFGKCAFQNHPDLKLFEDFFRLCGPELVSLEMHITHGESGKLLRSLKNLPDLNLPKLKTLEMRASYYRQTRVKKQPGIVALIDLLFTAATTLEEFGLSYPAPYSSTHPKQPVILMQQLGQLIARSSPGTLKRLNLSLQINESTFGNLAEAGLKLERFEFGIATKLGSRTLYKFLQSQAPTLQALRIWNSRRRSDCRTRNRMNLPMELPHLDKLVKLVLFDAIVSPTTTPAIDFAKSFPKLQRLNLRGMHSENPFQSLLSIAKKPAQSLKVLHLPVFYQPSLAPFVKIVAQSFPSLTELHIELHKGTKDTMREVFRHFDRLESLHVSFNERVRNVSWMESILSGASERDCDKIRRGQNFGSVNLSQFQRQPSILSLTRLRKLVVSVCGNSARIGRDRDRCVPFTDFSAHFILLEMEELREIELVDQDVQFSPRYLDLLKDKLVLREYDPETEYE